jgi:hypothetical protein
MSQIPQKLKKPAITGDKEPSLPEFTSKIPQEEAKNDTEAK